LCGEPHGKKEILRHGEKKTKSTAGENNASKTTAEEHKERKRVQSSVEIRPCFPGLCQCKGSRAHVGKKHPTADVSVQTTLVRGLSRWTRAWDERKEFTGTWTIGMTGRNNRKGQKTFHISNRGNNRNQTKTARGKKLGKGKARMGPWEIPTAAHLTKLKKQICRMVVGEKKKNQLCV